jgi:hypothetical protein
LRTGGYPAEPHKLGYSSSSLGSAIYSPLDELEISSPLEELEISSALEELEIFSVKLAEPSLLNVRFHFAGIAGNSGAVVPQIAAAV